MYELEDGRVKVVGVQLKDPMLSQVEESSRKQGVSLSAVIRIALSQYLEKEAHE